MSKWHACFAPGDAGLDDVVKAAAMRHLRNVGYDRFSLPTISILKTFLRHGTRAVHKVAWGTEDRQGSVGFERIRHGPANCSHVYNQDKNWNHVSGRWISSGIWVSEACNPQVHRLPPQSCRVY